MGQPFGLEIKPLAIGLAGGIIFDATVIRALLVPALMRLFGDPNWWMPKWTRAALRIRDREPLRSPASECA
jgi:putative drug exporter of the RND superfamily